MENGSSECVGGGVGGAGASNDVGVGGVVGDSGNDI